MGPRRSRYAGTVKTRLQHLVTAVAIDLARFAARVQDTPAAQTRRFASAS